MHTTPPPHPTRSRAPWLLVLFLVLALAAVAAVVVWLLWERRPRLSEEQIREAVYTRIQREAPQSFLVTGYLDVAATTTSTSRTVLLPGVLDLGVSRTRATVRVPARVAYGVDVRELTPEMIELEGDSLVVVTLPGIEVYSVAPNLSELRVRTDRGWVPIPGRVDPDVIERRALARAQQAMRRQAVEHLRTSVQPRVNTARAMERLLVPVLTAVGMEQPRLEFRLGRGVVIEAER